ncbi:spore coat U domain-containing protein [Chitinibacter sp. SCUT-21]|uniref:spore coat protein U domain-containing protein n=1 Tax=Chitinibacter sp. SCUT-21 TaxID=2970891 RepID=UPI0035A68AF8
MATHLLRLLSLACLIGLSMNAMAGGSANLQMQVTVLGSCSFVTSGDIILDFGALSHGDRTRQTQVPITCSNGTEFNARLSDGLYPSGTQRQMMLRTGTAKLPYDITVSPSRGVSQGGQINLQLSATVRESDYSNRPLGSYTDTVVLSVNP